MSLFTSKLPTETQAFIDSLPEGAHVNGIVLCPKTKEIKVMWECDRFFSGLSVPVDFEPKDIKAKKLPAGVRDTRKAPKKVLQEAVEAPPVEEVKSPVVAPVHMTAEEVEQAIKNGEKLEFSGIVPGWDIFDPKTHVYTAGYYYRKAAENAAA